MTPKRILIIDDNPSYSRLIQKVLAPLGCDCIGASTARRGLFEARTQHPSLILLDLALPGMNGFEIFQALRADRRTQHIPVILMTGLIETCDLLRAAAMTVKANDFFDKRSGMRVLAQRVTRLLRSGHRARKRHRHSCRAKGNAQLHKLSRGNIRADLVSRNVWIYGRIVPTLGPKRFEVLWMLLQNKNGISKATVLQSGIVHGETKKAVDMAIYRLRKDLGPDGKKLIRTIPGGYRLLS